MATELTFLRTGNWVTVTPCPQSVRDVLAPALTFTEKIFLQGAERSRARRNHTPFVKQNSVECFIDDHKGRVTFPYGFTERMAGVLAEKGHSVVLRNLTPPKKNVFDPQWDCIFNDEVKLRYKQDEFLLKIASHDVGRFDCPTGWGKSYLCGLYAKMLPLARVAVVSKSVTVVRDRLFPELTMMLPDVGIVGGGMKRRGRRVMCYTVDSMHWLMKDCIEYGNYDAVLFDECHLAGADNAAYMLGQIPGQPRMYGFSATHGMRADGKDYRVEGLFGPVRLKIKYDEARREGVVVPMEVKVRKVIMNVNPCADFVDEEKMRHGVWKNSHRNDMILKDAVGYAAQGMQTMISCAVLEHVLNVKKRFDRMKKNGDVPDGVDLVCLYRQHDVKGDHAKTLKEQKRKGMGKVFEALPYMSLKRRMLLTKQIEKGKIKLFVCTTVLNVGFDPKNMRVVCRADATSSETADHQIPGRNSRHAAGKTVGIIRDYWDVFDPGLSNRFRSRARSYRKLRWKVRIQVKKSLLNRKMHWE